MSIFVIKLYFLLLLIINCASLRLHDPVSAYSTNKALKKSSIKSPSSAYKWLEDWLKDIPIDHFSFVDNRTFSLRYLLNKDHFVSDGPIFFYTGNEGDIEGFAENTGLMWDLAPIFNAAIVFAEHRFYGKTQPFGNDSYKSVDNLGYLSSEQALADFSLLVHHLKNERLVEAKNSPVIAFGGSYGGMLSAWFRIKYPHLVEGAIAASAPVFWFPGTRVPENIYDRIVTRTFSNSGCVARNVRNSWDALDNLSTTATGRGFINRLFKLEKMSFINKTEDISFLRQFVREVFETLAMVNYPYPTNFLAQLPGWPVKIACQFFNSTRKRSNEEYVESLYAITNLFYNFTGSLKKFCVNPSACKDSAFSKLGSPLGWPWQACTEMVMQQCASGLPNDFFVKDCPFTIEGEAEKCNSMFSAIGYTSKFLRPNWAITNYGDYYPTASNIIFSNGYLDPWSGGGWSLKPKTVGSLISIIIKDGAHHYDLRGAHEMDTDSVKSARNVERAAIGKWIRKWAAKLPKNRRKP